MKKIMSMFLICALLLSSASCSGTNTDISPESGTTSASKVTTETSPSKTSAETSATETAQFALGIPLTKEVEYTDDVTGTLLMMEKYTLPQLTLQTADGSPIVSDNSVMADVCRAINTEIQRVAEEFETSAQKTLESAREAFANWDEMGNMDWMNYAEELNIEAVYLSDGILCIAGTGYFDGGGVHPSTYVRSLSFDLTTGESITYDTLTGSDNPLGQTLHDAIVYCISEQIDKQGLSEGYFDDYDSRVSDFTNNSSFCLNENGMTVTFDVYVLAPYALGSQTFTVPYDSFFYALGEHMQSLFDLPRDELVISDYRTAQVFWSWFNMSMPPLDSSCQEITTQDGVARNRVALGNVDTLDELRSLLCSRVSAELADEWLASGHFVDVDGKLYVSWGQRGSDITIGSADYIVSWNGEGGTLVQTIHRQDYDESTNTWRLTGETEEYKYPFTWTDGHAVFSAFPCPF